MGLGTSPKGSPVARDKRSAPAGIDFDLDSSAKYGTEDLDGPPVHSTRQEHQEAKLENNDDRAIASDPNAIGPNMRPVYEVFSPHFEDSNGFDQVWNETQRLPSEGDNTYPRRSYPA